MKSILKFLKKNYLLIFIFSLFIFYFSFPMLILYDSGHYMGYVSILEKIMPFSSWDIVRGPVFPVLIFLSNLVFGKTVMGLLLLSFIFYLIMIFVSKKIMDTFASNQKRYKIIIYILFICGVILNPIIFGYYHSLLTEFVAISLGLVSCYLSWKLLFVNYGNNRKRYLFIALFFIIVVPFSWFLKQPYLSTTLFPLIVSVIIQFFISKSKKQFWQKFLILFFSLLSLICGIFTWNKILEHEDIDTDSARSSSSFLGDFSIRALGNFELINIDDKLAYVYDAKFINDTEREFIEAKNGNFEIIEVYNFKKQLVDQMVIETDSNGLINGGTGLKFICSAFLKHPILTIDSYVSNYLGIIDIYSSKTDDGVYYYVKKDPRLFGCTENCAIAMRIIDEVGNIYPMEDEMYTRVVNYEQFNEPPRLLKMILNTNKYPSILSFNILLLLLPLIDVCAIVYSTINRKRLSNTNKENMYLVIILLSFSFLHILEHAVTGAVIDRYASPAYITTILGYIGFLCVVVNQFKLSKTGVKTI